MWASGAPGDTASLAHLVSRWTAVPTAAFAAAEPHAFTLETLPAASESPRLVTPALVEHAAVLAHRIADARPGGTRGSTSKGVATGFAAFLDGIQQSRVVGHCGGIPVVLGKVAAVIRRRVDRRLTTYGRGPLHQRALYAPWDRLPSEYFAAAEQLGWLLRDTHDPGEGASAAHPYAITERALHLVQDDRERLEHRLAETWCSAEQAPLYVDGSVSRNEKAAVSPHVVGVVKSHRTLYVAPDDLSTLMRLRGGERTTVVRLTSHRRTPVLSWYLRVREEAKRGPLWGLVRIEVAEVTDSDSNAVTHRADEVCRWVLDEMAAPAPLSLPDPRWDTLAYGIHDCEAFLRAVV
jgi:hypothetical protein